MKKNPNSNLNGRLSKLLLAPGSASATSATEECSQCGTKKGWVLHNVRYRANLRGLCTSCVLLLHPATFCPTCFRRNSQTTPDNLVSCSNCPSALPLRLPTSFSPSPFLCPPCASGSPSKFCFFELDDRDRVLDKRLATALLCAATIAAEPMAKVVGIARADAERRVREAATATKRACEALDRFMVLSSKNISKSESIYCMYLLCLFDCLV